MNKDWLDVNRGELPIGKNVLVISRRALGHTRKPPKNFIIDELVRCGAPVKVTRKNNLNFPEYQDSEIEFTGVLIECPQDPAYDLLRFEWY